MNTTAYDICQKREWGVGTHLRAPDGSAEFVIDGFTEGSSVLVRMVMLNGEAVNYPGELDLTEWETA